MSSIPEYLRRDPAWEEAKARLWAMTRDERIAAMHAGALSCRQCLHWANHAPDEVPLINGEFAFIAETTPEVAELDERPAKATGKRGAS